MLVVAALAVVSAGAQAVDAGPAWRPSAVAGAAVETAPPAAPAPRYRSAVFPELSISHDLRYGRAPDASGQPEDLKLDLYQPQSDEARQRPAVVWVHGGSFVSGDKANVPAAELAARFARMGYVTVSINYRLLAPNACSGSGGVSEQCYSAALAAGEDAKAAVRWLRAQAATYRIDPTRIAIGGDSAGGVLAAGVGVRPEQPGSSGNPGFSSKVQAWMSFSGGLPNGIFVGPGDAPGLLIHGTADDIVPYSFATDTAAAMRRAGVPVELVPLQGAGHDPWLTYGEDVIRRTTDFFYRYLQLGTIAGFTG